MKSTRRFFFLIRAITNESTATKAMRNAAHAAEVEKVADADRAFHARRAR